jgi:glutathione synthase/RimK-type ligase-like ATP-grasp enzyme
MFIYSHNPNSEGAKALAEALKATRIRHEKSTFKGAANKVVINWGAHNLPEEVAKCRIINTPAAIQVAANKLSFFQQMSNNHEGPRVPPWTTNTDQVGRWLNDGLTVVARTVLNGSSGVGMLFIEPGNLIPLSPLYTQYIKKKTEYRIHFMNGRIIDTQRKALRPEFKDGREINWRVRNLDNGFVFIRNDIVVPGDVVTQANLAIAATDLDFGAIDLIYNEQSNQAYVLEINTAPGLVGTTVTNYANAFASL